MLRKLYAFVQGRCREDRPDALANHELLLPGHLFGMIVKERMEGWLEKVRTMGEAGWGGAGRGAHAVLFWRGWDDNLIERWFICGKTDTAVC